jgi:hypothetical protein
MMPTSRLRFVEREIANPYEFELGKYITLTKTVRFLQQWWEPEYNIIDMVVDKKIGQWRDVPIEKEQV